MYEIVVQCMQISVDKIWGFASVWVTREIVWWFWLQFLLNLTLMIIAFSLREGR